MNAFMFLQVGYCPLVWMFHSRKLNNHINNILERASRNIFGDYESSFQQLLKSIYPTVVNILPPPTPPNFETRISSQFFYFRKICSHHHCHHFHVRFCGVLSIGWGEMKAELKIKHFWFGIGWRVFEGNPLIFAM